MKKMIVLSMPVMILVGAAPNVWSGPAINAATGSPETGSIQTTTHSTGTGIVPPNSVPDDGTVRGTTSTTVPTTSGSSATSPDDNIAGSGALSPDAPGTQRYSVTRSRAPSTGQDYSSSSSDMTSQGYNPDAPNAPKKKPNTTSQ